MRATARPALVAALSAGACSVAFLGLAAPASAGGSFAGDTNALRAAHGLAGYRLCGDLDALAARWAANMAATHRLYHNPGLTSQVADWQSVGENVGDGPAEPDIQNAFVHSPEHYANLTSRSFIEAGYGTAVSSDGQLWVDEIFRQPEGNGCGAPPVVVNPPTVTQTAPVVRSVVPTRQLQRGGAVRAAAPVTAAPVVTHAVAPVVVSNPRVVRTAAVHAHLVVLARTPARDQDVVGAALAFAHAMAVS